MVQQISVAETYEARYELLCSGNHPKYKNYFLYEALNRANGADDRVYLSEYTPADERTHIRTPFFGDPDSGPSDGWRWAHQDETWANFVNQDNRKTLREWGYVMWNRVRLDESGIFQDIWEPSYPNDEESQVEIQRRAEMEASWEARSKIYIAGGRGWWAFGNHGRVIWPNRKGPQSRSVVAHTVPNSLEEARDAFRLMKLPDSVARLDSK